MLSLHPTDHFRSTTTFPLHHRPVTPVMDVPSSKDTGLPSELILDIFELGASTDRKTAISLIQSTTWARKLLLPRLYHSVLLNSWSRVDQFKQTMKGQHRDEIRMAVKRLTIDVGEYPVADILSSCNAITALTVSSSLFRQQADCYLPPNLLYSPTKLSPHLTHLVITGLAYHIQPSMLPSSVTHIIFKDDAPVSGYSLKAVLELPKLTHIAFKVHQQPLPFAPDPSPRYTHLLDSLFQKGVPGTTAEGLAPDTVGRPDLDPTPVALIAVILTANVDSRIVETFADYQPKVSLDPFTRADPMIRPVLNVMRDQERAWWSQEEWMTKGGELEFWKRMAETH